ncbi:HNH endonuclease [Chroococcidiopsis sp. TS-821]|uniref:HNH endonuclease n=1 Tax=Chroococcidiopsis sp. TS-821 TaxID=1378066 RepID=UPI000CEEE753|nr:HNH endonuclease [Chroococcidiopsis sp. TS-821]PPS41950.1 HNH endonuclease [Chroococcidiopsis sp. TS-821]
MVDKNLNYYANKFAKLRVHRAHGAIAPHKPILLLSVIELIEQGLLSRNQISLSAELIAAFLKLWQYLGSTTHNADIGLPFFHLQSGRFWHFKPNPGFEAVLSSGVKVRSVGIIRQVFEYAYLDEELFEILQQPSLRSVLTKVLLDTWFADKMQQVQEAFRIDAFAELQQEFLATGGKIYQPDELKNETKLVARDATFRRVIVSVYEYRCAFCGLQILSSLGQNIVDGSHIMPFSQFYDDRIDNGLSLCKNHHWAFDRGWFSVSDEFTLLVQDDLREDAPNCKPMQQFKGNRIHLPTQQQYYPRLEALRWHRQHIFGAA